MRKNKIFRIGFVIGIGLFCLVNQSLAVNTDQGIDNNIKLSEIDQVLKLEIPSSWGIIKDSYNSGTNKLIVNIQDAHCDFEAQKNIANILNRLANNYKLRLIAIEGASGKVENPILSNFPKKKVRKNVSLYLVKQGKLTGAEYFAVNSGQDLKLYGVEDMSLYMNNLDTFQQAQPFKAKAKKYLSAIKKSLDILKQSIYNDDLKKIDTLKNDYALRKISFDKYAVRLYKLVEENGLRKVNYPIFYELQDAIKLESGVDFKKADTERMQLITALTQIINDKETISQLIGKSISFKKGMLSAGGFANFLKDLAFDNNLNMSAYPNFDAYAKYITKYEQVANEKLFLEIKRITKDLRKVFYTDNDQKQLDNLYTDLDILVKLINLKMVNEDITYFFRNRDRMNSESFRSFIVPQAYKHKVIVSLPSGLSYIDKYIPSWAKFYELANTRDEAFIENTLLHMNVENADYAVLITGGFHTKQLTRLLKEKNISYLVIAPKASANDSNPYINIMQGGKTAIETFVTSMQSTLGVFRGADEEALAELSPAQQTALKAMVSTEDQVTTLALAVETFAAIAADNPDADDSQIQKEVVNVFKIMNKDGTKIDMEDVELVVGKMSMQGESVVVENSDRSARLIFNPQETNAENRITFISRGSDNRILSSAPSLNTADRTGSTETSKLSIESIGVNASAKDVLKAVLKTSTSRQSIAALEPIQAAFIVEEVVSDLAIAGTVDAKAVSNKLKTEHEQLFLESSDLLEKKVENIVSAIVSETLQNSSLTDQAVDIIAGEKGLDVAAAKQETAKGIIRSNITDTGKMTVQLNQAGINVNKEQVTESVNTGLAETSKTSANSGNIIAKVVVSKLNIRDDTQKEKAAEIIKGLVTSSAEVVTKKLKNAGISVSETQVAKAMHQGLLQANAAANPIMSGISSTSDLSAKEQESVIASQLKPRDISLIQYKTELLSGTPEGQGLVFQADDTDQKILSITESAGVKKETISSVVIASGDYSEVESVSVNIKPSARDKGKETITINPKKSDDQISEDKERLASAFQIVEGPLNTLNNKAKDLSSAVIHFQAKKLQSDIEEFQKTNVEAKSQANNAPKLKEKNVIVIPMSMLGKPNFEASVENQIPVQIKGLASQDMWDRITEHNDVVIMHDIVGDNKTEVNEADFARAMGISDKAISFVGPLDVGEMESKEMGATGSVTPLATYQVLEKRGTNIKNICYITQKGSKNNKLADRLKNNTDIDAAVTVTTYPKVKDGQIINVNVCFTEAVHAFIMGDKGGQLSASQKKEYTFLIKSVLGDFPLIKDDETFDDIMSEQFQSTSKISTTNLDKKELTVYVAAATYA